MNKDALVGELNQLILNGCEIVAAIFIVPNDIIEYEKEMEFEEEYVGESESDYSESESDSDEELRISFQQKNVEYDTNGKEIKPFPTNDKEMENKIHDLLENGYSVIACRDTQNSRVEYLVYNKQEKTGFWFFGKHFRSKLKKHVSKLRRSKDFQKNKIPEYAKDSKELQILKYKNVFILKNWLSYQKELTNNF